MLSDNMLPENIMVSDNISLYNILVVHFVTFWLRFS
jgi:hypothetical protein